MLSENTGLLWLDLSWNALTGQGSEPIFVSLGARNSLLTSKTRENQLIMMSHHLENSTLRSLNLSWCGLGNKSSTISKTIVDCLHANKTLTDLVLSNNQLSVEACTSIVGSLAKKGSRMRALHLDGNEPSPTLSNQAIRQSYSHNLMTFIHTIACLMCLFNLHSKSCTRTSGCNTKPERPASSSKPSPSPRTKRLGDDARRKMNNKIHKKKTEK